MREPPRPEAGPDHFVTVLFVSSCADDHHRLREIFAHTNWRLTTVDTFARATAALCSGRHAVAICESNLQRGAWKELLEQTKNAPSQPLLIVTSAHADDQLWAEALNLGAYDVLPTPFEPQEVVHVVSAAWLHWRSRRRAQGHLTAEREFAALCA